MGTSGTVLALHDPELPGFVTDGGLETDLIFHHGVDLPEFAAFPLLDDHTGRLLLASYFDGYAAVAAAASAGLLVETPTWRANPDWAQRVGYGARDLARVTRDSVIFARSLARRYADDVPAVIVSGTLGPRGDGYVVGEVPRPEEARDYHAVAISAFAESGVDLVVAYTLTTAAEAVGVVLAARDAGVPVAVSFTVETDGRLPDGSTLAQAVAEVDALAPPEHYLVNCAHPSHVRAGLDGGAWQERVLGTRVNASARSHAELDAADDLDDGDPELLANDQGDLSLLLPRLRVVGGCCGTDVRHVASMWGVPESVGA
ncbi:homocysteine S-methyltransferase family protein [Oryzobacter telluris]|uniref:homocysteine S-methyltransferase family protein n=1 Tax=Oryzobacter telluris TaxID=3149179 RepID=UPI00370D0FDF